MTASVTLAVVVAALTGVGFLLLTSGALSRVIIGFVLIGHAANVLLLLAGGPGVAVPVIGATEQGSPADPLVQAFALTAIVITFGVTVLLLALLHRANALHGTDALHEDPEDRRVARMERADEEPPS